MWSQAFSRTRRAKTDRQGRITTPLTAIQWRKRLPQSPLLVEAYSKGAKSTWIRAGELYLQAQDGGELYTIQSFDLPINRGQFWLSPQKPLYQVMFRPKRWIPDIRLKIWTWDGEEPPQQGEIPGIVQSANTVRITLS